MDRLIRRVNGFIYNTVLRYDYFAVYSAQGIILKREDFRERDERVVLYTKDFGKISVIAKGTKRIEAKLRGNLDIFNFADIIFVEGSRFFILTGIETKERFAHIAKHPSLYKTALAMADMTDTVFQENLPDPNFYEVFVSLIRALDRCYTNSRQNGEIDLYSWLIQKKFQIMALEHEGYRIDESRLSHNAETLLQAMRVQEKRDGTIRLSARDFRDIEGLFQSTFSKFFHVRVATWIPKIKSA